MGRSSVCGKHRSKSKQNRRKDSIDKNEKKVIVIEMSCPWLENRQSKDLEKTQKYGPLRWELKRQFQVYEVTQHNIIMDVLGGYSKDDSGNIGWWER